MQLHIHPNAKEFLWYNQRFLEKEEVTNGLLLGLALRMAKDVSAQQDALFYSVRKNARPIFACIQTATPRYFIFSPAEDGAWQLMLDTLINKGIPIPGLLGPRQLVNKAAKYWAAYTGGQTDINMRQLIYRLDMVIPVEEKEGRLRQAQGADYPLLKEWVKAFSKESLGELLTPEEVSELTKRKIEEADLFVWEDKNGAILSMAGIARPTTNGMCINYVYTPPAHRKRGLASSCVASLS
ncbi:MAG: hypothetical protein AAF705_20695, partial [Bacteroidota bacterium]